MYTRKILNTAIAALIAVNTVVPARATYVKHENTNMQTTLVTEAVVPAKPTIVDSGLVGYYQASVLNSQGQEVKVSLLGSSPAQLLEKYGVKLTSYFPGEDYVNVIINGITYKVDRKHNESDHKKKNPRNFIKEFYLPSKKDDSTSEEGCNQLYNVTVTQSGSSIVLASFFGNSPTEVISEAASLYNCPKESISAKPVDDSIKQSLDSLTQEDIAKVLEQKVKEDVNQGKILLPGFLTSNTDTLQVVSYDVNSNSYIVDDFRINGQLVCTKGYDFQTLSPEEIFLAFEDNAVRLDSIFTDFNCVESAYNIFSIYNNANNFFLLLLNQSKDDAKAKSDTRDVILASMDKVLEGIDKSCEISDYVEFTDNLPDSSNQDNKLQNAYQSAIGSLLDQTEKTHSEKAASLDKGISSIEKLTQKEFEALFCIDTIDSCKIEGPNAAAIKDNVRELSMLVNAYEAVKSIDFPDNPEKALEVKDGDYVLQGKGGQLFVPVASYVETKEFGKDQVASVIEQNLKPLDYNVPDKIPAPLKMLTDETIRSQEKLCKDKLEKSLEKVQNYGTFASYVGMGVQILASPSGAGYVAAKAASSASSITFCTLEGNIKDDLKNNQEFADKLSSMSPNERGKFLLDNSKQASDFLNCDLSDNTMSNVMECIAIEGVSYAAGKAVTGYLGALAKQSGVKLPMSLYKSSNAKTRVWVGNKNLKLSLKMPSSKVVTFNLPNPIDKVVKDYTKGELKDQRGGKDNSGNGRMDYDPPNRGYDPSSSSGNNGPSNQSSGYSKDNKTGDAPKDNSLEGKVTKGDGYSNTKITIGPDRSARRESELGKQGNEKYNSEVTERNNSDGSKTITGKEMYSNQRSDGSSSARAVERTVDVSKEGKVTRESKTEATKECDSKGVCKVEVTRTEKEGDKSVELTNREVEKHEVQRQERERAEKAERAERERQDRERQDRERQDRERQDRERQDRERCERDREKCDKPDNSCDKPDRSCDKPDRSCDRPDRSCDRPDRSCDRGDSCSF